ncbi:hypothetical protein JZ751_026036 [Albula glossodonta]|uniref:G-protein coupled receptors family 1 profile domain-containing protein n=1 Tax=Albula glossodonta TaxID=121402 RepID=A0A8T2MW54_9TELE|nr:hypothetical protein JZ751_026036 [Albula glossodonta]
MNLHVPSQLCLAAQTGSTQGWGVVKARLCYSHRNSDRGVRYCTASTEAKMDYKATTEYGYQETEFNLTDLTEDFTELNLTQVYSHSGFEVLVIVTYSFVLAAGVVGNAAVIYIVAFRSHWKRLIDIFITHLAVADLVFLITLPFWIVSFSAGGRWQFGDELCKLSSYVIAVNMFSSVFFLVCMSVDRFMAVVLVLDTRTVRTRRNAHLASLVVWATSLGLGAHAIVSRATDKELRCADVPSSWSTAVFLAVRVVGFLLPLLVIAVCYTCVALKLYRHFHGVGAAGRRGRRSVKVGLWILALFVVAWLPFNALATVRRLGEDGKLTVPAEVQARLNGALVFATSLAFGHSCVNPVVYLLLDQSVRRHARGLLPRALRRATRGPRRSLSSSATQPDTDSAFSKTLELQPAGSVPPLSEHQHSDSGTLQTAFLHTENYPQV